MPPLLWRRPCRSVKELFEKRFFPVWLLPVGMAMAIFGSVVALIAVRLRRYFAICFSTCSSLRSSSP